MSSYFGGYIWQLIWVLHLTSWPSCALHLKTWPNSAIHFKWALTDDIDQQRFHLLSLTVSCGGYIWQLIWVLHLKIWTCFEIYSCFTEVFSMKDQLTLHTFLISVYNRSVVPMFTPFKLQDNYTFRSPCSKKHKGKHFLHITKCHLLQKVFKLQVLWSSHQFIKQSWRRN